MISETIDHTSDPRRFSAPTMKQFSIDSIIISNFIVAENGIIILDRYLDDDIIGAIAPSLHEVSNSMIIFEANTSATFHMTNLRHQTKYITIARTGSATILTFVYVYGDIIKMSKEDAIWEFIAKRRH